MYLYVSGRVVSVCVFSVATRTRVCEVHVYVHVIDDFRGSTKVDIGASTQHLCMSLLGSMCRFLYPLVSLELRVRSDKDSFSWPSRDAQSLKSHLRVLVPGLESMRE